MSSLAKLRYACERPHARAVGRSPVRVDAMIMPEGRGNGAEGVFSTMRLQIRIGMCCAAIGVLSAAQSPTGQPGPVDLVVVNAKVLTVDPKQTEAEAVAIRGNIFAAIGTTAAIRKMAG